MPRLARREITADEITTVPEGGKLKMIDGTKSIDQVLDLAIKTLGVWIYDNY